MSGQFFEAIRAGNKTVVEQMLAADSQLVRTRDADGLSPIMAAAYFQHLDLARLLADHTVTITIFEAAATGKFQQFIMLLARNPELVNVYGEDGFQPLGLAAMFGHMDIVNFLLRAGAYVNSPSRNDLHATPLHSAVAGGHLKVVRALLDEGADPNMLQAGNYSPLHFAALRGDIDMIRLLLERGARSQAATEAGKTAYDLAMDKGFTLAAKLIRSGITRHFTPAPSQPKPIL